MRHDHRRPSSLDLQNRIEHEFLIRRVKRGRALVENEKLPRLYERTGNLHPLRLTARNERGVVAQEGFVPLRQRLDKVMNVRRLGRLLDLFAARRRAAVRDVVRDGYVEEGGVLRDDGDVVAEVLDVGAGEGAAVEEDFAGGGLVETLEEGGGGRFAGTGGATGRGGEESQLPVSRRKSEREEGGRTYPTTPTHSPGWISNVKPLRIGASGLDGYANLTSENETWP